MSTVSLSRSVPMTDSAPRSSTSSELAMFRQSLADAARTRNDQLDDIDPMEGDPVLRSQRDSLLQILKEIEAAEARLDEGTYGSCTRCHESVPTARLEIRPWSTTCIDCAEL